MAIQEHLVFVPETTWGVYVTPTMAIPVRSASFHAMRPLHFLAETGAGRARRLGVLGEKPVHGGFEANFSPIYMPYWLRSIMGSRTVAKLPVPPSFTSATGAITGGTLAAGAYKYYVTTVDATGEGGPGTELTGTVASGSTGSVVLVWTATAAAGAANYKVYRTAVGGATGTEKFLVTVAFGTNTYTDTGGVTLSATAINTTTCYQSDMVPDDSVDYGSFSVQQLNNATHGTAYKGVRLDSAMLSLRAKEPVIFKATCLVQDEAYIGSSQYWGDGVTVGPTTHVTPAYSSVLVEPFKFYQAALTYGGTPTLTSNAFAVAGGTTFTGIEAIDIDVKLAHDPEGFVVNGGDPTIQFAVATQRVIQVKITADWSTLGSTFWAQWMAGSSTTLVIDMKSNYGVTGGGNATTIGLSARPYEMRLTLPYLRYADAMFPDIAGAIARRKQTLTFEAYQDPVSGKDWGISMFASDDLT